MKSVFILTKSLYLYSDTGIVFHTLMKSKNISAEELIRSIPKGVILSAHYTQETAETAVRKQRKMSLVEDENRNNPIGYTYRSVYTPIILEVQLKNEMNAVNDEKSCEMDWSLIDLSQPIKVINVEEGYKGNMPDSITLSEEKLNEILTSSSCILI